MFKKFFQRRIKSKPSYIESIDHLEYLDIIRLKGAVDQTVIPVIAKRIQLNRNEGGTIDKNILLDFKNVTNIDSATIAFNVVSLKEYQQKNYKLALVNISEAHRVLLQMFKQSETFAIYDDEKKAIDDLNRTYY